MTTVATDADFYGGQTSLLLVLTLLIFTVCFFAPAVICVTLFFRTFPVVVVAGFVIIPIVVTASSLSEVDCD